ncbi:MAG TPA: hypothetical protein PLN48_17545 [Lachnospiraceae bacterium]|nr:hypothetical protein [Lachnospiraceae bacterium]
MSIFKVSRILTPREQEVFSMPVKEIKEKISLRLSVSVDLE